MVLVDFCKVSAIASTSYVNASVSAGALKHKQRYKSCAVADKSLLTNLSSTPAGRCNPFSLSLLTLSIMRHQDVVYCFLFNLIPFPLRKSRRNFLFNQWIKNSSTIDSIFCHNHPIFLRFKVFAYGVNRIHTCSPVILIRFFYDCTHCS